MIQFVLNYYNYCLLLNSPNAEKLIVQQDVAKAKKAKTITPSPTCQI
jgi:hypothetical protein